MFQISRKSVLLENQVFLVSIHILSLKSNLVIREKLVAAFLSLITRFLL